MKEELIERLSQSIAFAAEAGEDADAASWSYQEGILISCNEAKLIVEALKNYSK